MWYCYFQEESQELKNDPRVGRPTAAHSEDTTTPIQVGHKT